MALETKALEADGEAVWSWRPDAGVKSVKEISLATVATKPGHRGERGISRKTIARGMPGVFGVTVVTCLRAFYLCTQGCGRVERPAFPAPLLG
jgi:hypothetical protein